MKKRIMILGGSRYAIPVIKAAHDLGAYVISVDYLPNNIAHKYSDEYCNISVIEKEAVLEKAKEKHIDGISSFACDPGVITAAYVADKMGLPSCGPYESVCILQNKGLFRKFLSEHGFNVPAACAFTDIDKAIKEIGNFHFPVIVKPTDSAGSKGVRKVEKIEDIRSAIEYAVSFSCKREFIIEEFITPKGYSSDTDSFFVNGKFKFISFNSQRFDSKAENPYTPAAYSWPSSISLIHQEELRKELQRLLDLLEMRDSVYNIETREGTDGKAYIMECSPRGGGNRLSECLEYATGVKLVENSVRAALGMSVMEIEQKPYNGYWAELILHSDKRGIFDSLWISPEIEKEAFEKDLWISSGTAVGGFSAANEAIGTLVLRFSSEERLESVMSSLSNYVQVILKG